MKVPPKLKPLLRPLYLYHGHLKHSGIRGALRLTAALAMRIVAPLYTRLGASSRECPCCGWNGRNFMPYVAGGYVTFQAECPRCGWHARHRGHRLFYERVLRMPERRGRMLYFAPEQSVLDYIRATSELQVETSGYRDPGTDHDVDIMDIPFEDDTWDWILCHRVIEHIPDDRKGLRELYRILKPSGTLVLSVPIYRETTIDYGAPNPLEDDHYYNYGLDFEERIPAGFETRRYTFSELFTPEEFRRMALTEDYVFVCRKQGPG